MNRERLRCGACGRFIPDRGVKAGQDGPGYCEVNERPAHSTDKAGVFFLERGSRAHRQAARSEAEVLADLQRRYPSRTAETISRASASTTTENA